MSPDLDALWADADPVAVGERLRSARRRADLTQDELGEGVASAAYVSRLESGARRGDLSLFVAFAERLGVDLRTLLVGADEVADDPAVALTVDYAELELASGNAVEAERGVAAISDDQLASLSVDLGRAVRRVRAGSFEAQGRLDLAIEQGEALAAGPRRDLAWIKDLIALSRCYREAGHLTRAIEVGDRAEEEIERVGLVGTTEAIQLVLTVASAHSERGDLVRAAQLCRAAMQRADELGSPVARASAYWNASVLEYEQGHVAEAVPLARQALAEFERSEGSRNLGRLRGTLGVLLTRLDPPELPEAIATLELSRVELQASSAGRYDLARSSCALADACLQDGDRDAAQRWLEDALELVDEDAPVVLANVLSLQGQLAFAAGDVDAAAEHYRAAVHALTAIGSDRSAGELWYELAALLESVGDTAGALTAYRAAGASLGLVPRPGIGEHADPA